MKLQNVRVLQPLPLPVREISFIGSSLFLVTAFPSRKLPRNTEASVSRVSLPGLCSTNFMRSPMLMVGNFRRGGLTVEKTEGKRKVKVKSEESNTSDGEDDSYVMNENERQEFRREVRKVMNMNPNVNEEVDLDGRKKKMQKLLADYPLVVEEEDPDWPEDGDGWGFNMGQFFDKITIKNNKKDDDDYDSKNEVVWQDDDYIRPIKDITTVEWEEAVFKDISPLVVLIHNRYKRPKENEAIRNELEKSIHIIWNCRLPSPRCVAVDAVVELDLVSALGVSVYPELLFTKAGKILYRENEFRTADELSKIMAFFYYGAAKPPCLNIAGMIQDIIPNVSVGNQKC